MEKKGLCQTCVNLLGCIFKDNLPVLQCEEFASPDYVIRKARQPKAKQVFVEAATEE